MTRDDFRKLSKEFQETNKAFERARKARDGELKGLTDAVGQIKNIVKDDFGTFLQDITTLGGDIANAIPGVRSIAGISKFLFTKGKDKFFESRKEKQLRESLGYKGKEGKEEFQNLQKKQRLEKTINETTLKQLEQLKKTAESLGLSAEETAKRIREGSKELKLNQDVVDKYQLEELKKQVENNKEYSEKSSKEKKEYFEKQARELGIDETILAEYIKKSFDKISSSPKSSFESVSTDNASSQTLLTSASEPLSTFISGQSKPIEVTFAEGIGKALQTSTAKEEGGGAAVEKMKEAQSIEFQKIDLLTSINESLASLLGVTKEGQKEKPESLFSKLFSGITGAIGGALAGLGTTLASSVSGALKGAGSLVSGAGKGAGQAVQTVGKFAKNVPFGQLSKALPIAGLAVGLAEAIYDGFIGWTKSEEWGVSSIAGALGGFFAGDGAGGLMNAFTNAGKWAGIGAGVGMIFGPPGIIAGGLLGAAIGGILGFIGAEKVAKALDGIGAWFNDAFNALIIAPIKGIWEAVAPDWLKEIKFEWKDLLPPALISLFSGEYFTVKWDAFSWYDLFPKFLVDFFNGTTKKLEQQTWSWTDLFPKFLVDVFNNVTKELAVTSWSWTDLLPPFLQKFFAGQYAVGKDEFEWKDLVPPFIIKAIEIGENALADVDFSWRSLLPGFIVKVIDAASDTLSKMDWSWKSILPNFLVKIIDGEAIEDKEKEFEWRDLVPGFITKIVDGFVEANPNFTWSNLLPTWMASAWDATKKLVSGETTFEWKNLLPDWMVSAYDATKKAIYTGFDWQNILPDWMIGAWDSTKGLAVQSSNFDWRNIFPQFIRDLFPSATGPMTIAKGMDAIGSFDWRALLPQFIQDLFPSMTGQPLTIAKGLESVTAWSWKSLLPQFITNLIDGKPLADAEKGFDWKDLLPQFIRDFLGDEKVEVAGGLYVGWWKSLLPNFITNFIDGKPIFGATDESGSLQDGWWKSLLPNWAKNIVEGKSPFATMTEGLEDGWWKKLLPTWAVNIIDGKLPFSTELPSIADMETKVKDFGKKIYDPETGAVFGLTLPTLPSIADIKTKLDDFGKKIYDPATESLFGFTLPEMPTIAGITEKITGFGTKISDFFGSLFNFDSITKFIKDKIPFSSFIFGDDEEESKPSATSTETVTQQASPALMTNLSQADVDAVMQSINPIENLKNFAKSVGERFDEVFDTTKIKQFVLDYIPFASLLIGEGEKKEEEELKPAETNDIITAIFGTTNLTDFLVKTFSEIVDTLIYNIDTLLGEIIPGYESRAEKIESLKEKLKDEANPWHGNRNEEKIASIGKELQDLGVSEDEVKTLLIEKKAKGGILPKGTIGLVGEAGPELITPTESSQQVINSNQTNTILEKLVRTTTARTQMLEQGSKNMASMQQPVIINNVDNSVKSNGGGGATPIPIPKPITNPNTDLLAAVAAVF